MANPKDPEPEAALKNVKLKAANNFMRRFNDNGDLTSQASRLEAEIAREWLNLQVPRDLSSRSPPSAITTNDGPTASKGIPAKFPQLPSESGSRPLATPASRAEKNDITLCYAQNFFIHFRDLDFAHQEAVAHEVYQRVATWKHSVVAFHVAYYRQMMRHMRGCSAKDLHHVGREFSKFCAVQHYWWPRCVELLLPSHDLRRTFVEDVFKAVARKDFLLATFVAGYRDCYDEDHVQRMVGDMLGSS
ncbi:hypothetical protein PV04_01360 [Phialophora macrospora]|uniref:Uncharacterized protein n=1 Tax=Phialophora macrospora TaxID=1851006 RepID=A0A0D2D6N1_9EURO|nr:hypothetical protein PV04_01360 [Phialophora macrospora]